MELIHGQMEAHRYTGEWTHNLPNGFGREELSDAVFPKVRSADHFWSAGIFNLVRENENRSYFKLLCYKTGQLCRKTSYFMVRRRLFSDFGVRQNFFPYFMVRKLKKFGKHWLMELFMKATLKMDYTHAVEPSHGQTEMLMKETLKMDFSMVTEK